jgi:nitrous oxide reductase accessory protein NosL
MAKSITVFSYNFNGGVGKKEIASFASKKEAKKFLTDKKNKLGLKNTRWLDTYSFTSVNQNGAKTNWFIV